MPRSLPLASLLLLSSALVAPSVANAQTSSGGAGGSGGQSSGTITPPADPQTTPAEEPTDVSVPGSNGDIVIVGRRSSDLSRTRPQVVSVLSSADIARTGEGDIAGALGRVTGLSVVGNGFVYVRGLGDRYSLALLNGSPLPSPEPLKRVVPLDIFPTSVIASSLVQKSYSVNFPGEFGGGVINLTTKAIPTESFLAVGGGIGVDTEVTARLGYTYFGSSSDWTGFDNGTRDLKPALAAYLRSGNRISSGTVDTQAIASQLVTGRNSVIQRNTDMPPNTAATITGGTYADIGSVRLGMIGSAGYSSKWRTRDTLQQTASTRDLSQKELDFERVITDDRIVVNGLLGFGLEFGENKIRWTNLYIRDTLKQARLGVGTRATSGSGTLQQQDTAWFARQLIDTQIVGEFTITPEISLDLRGGYANSKRQSPDEFSFEYSRSNSPTDIYGSYFVNRLNNGQSGSGTVSYSNLNEDLYSAGADLTYKPASWLTTTVGYGYSDTQRKTERRDFQFSAPGTLPAGVSLLRPDLLLEPTVINYFKINLIDTNEANPVFLAKLRNHAGYLQLQAQFTPELSLDTGVRYEAANQTVTPVQVFTVPTASLAGTALKRNYWLPAATLTYKLTDQMQLRLNASKTIARPQFRELIYQLYYDPDSNRQYRGNPLLVDSQLYNAEARFEWYFAPQQRFSIAGFYKRIDKPIETFASFSDNAVVSSFANAPKADLYGGEVEAVKYFDLGGLGAVFDTRRLVVSANYTYTKSKIKVTANDTVAVFAVSSTRATDFFVDGSPLTGQSDHLANLEIGFEDKDRLSQQTLLLTYASDRVTNRGASGQPDIIERPGFHLDLVLREGFDFLGLNSELKFEARNLTSTKYQEFQQSGANRVYYNRYNVGTVFNLSFGVKF
ncbi:TonB-dependent receptor domain-containing protein [uncultured Sphingomonas sp.]|uniref:TonB-dependent receptor domain-containing protein n=1 Tax=uncultured Sphingomonas sp. TaxID=158754 RepID=UPI0035CAABA8